jgi:hypothetical protein
MNIDPELDGIDHINIYSQSKTELGRFLSNFAYSPFDHPEDGNFVSVEGYWYWLGCKNDQLRTLYGAMAKKIGREYDAPDYIEDSEFKRKIKIAILIKIKNSNFLNMFKESTLPFLHYYNYKGKIVVPKEGVWVIEYIENLRKFLGEQK